MRGVRRPFEERFTKSVGCWVWRDSVGSHGYGQLMVAGTNWTAHRYAWTQAYGPIPTGLYVLHHCDNRRCVRPDHLWLGSVQDNLRDMRAKGRGRGGGARGESQWNAKLTPETVRELRRRVGAGEDIRRTAASLGVGAANAYRIVEGKSWRHLL